MEQLEDLAFTVSLQMMTLSLTMAAFGIFTEVFPNTPIRLLDRKFSTTYFMLIGLVYFVHRAPL